MRTDSHYDGCLFENAHTARTLHGLGRLLDNWTLSLEFAIQVPGALENGYLVSGRVFTLV
jgi:hypothetical protein